jgi:hypothetical protein
VIPTCFPVSFDEFDTPRLESLAETVLTQVLLGHMHEARNLVDTDNVSWGPILGNQVVEYGRQVAGSAANVKHASAWLEVREKIFRCMGMLRKIVRARQIRRRRTGLTM